VGPEREGHGLAAQQSQGRQHTSPKIIGGGGHDVIIDCLKGQLHEIFDVWFFA